MRILVTNDDGIASPGLAALARGLSSIGEVWIVAPDRERTAVAHSVTLHKPLRVHRTGARIYTVNGTPVDCVNLALLKILPKPPTIVVSGINKGVNLGDDVMYSGTVSAAMAEVDAKGPTVEITTSGYKPDTITAVVGKPVTITFIRRTDQTCGTEIVFPDLKITKPLPLDKPVEVTVTPKRTGELRFTCGMDMLRGKVLVK